jgi:hypothetical protein
MRPRVEAFCDKTGLRVASAELARSNPAEVVLNAVGKPDLVLGFYARIVGSTACTSPRCGLLSALA